MLQACHAMAVMNSSAAAGAAQAPLLAFRLALGSAPGNPSLSPEPPPPTLSSTTSTKPSLTAGEAFYLPLLLNCPLCARR